MDDQRRLEIARLERAARAEDVFFEGDMTKKFPNALINNPPMEEDLAWIQGEYQARRDQTLAEFYARADESGTGVDEEVIQQERERLDNEIEELMNKLPRPDMEALHELKDLYIEGTKEIDPEKLKQLLELYPDIESTNLAYIVFEYLVQQGVDINLEGLSEEMQWRKAKILYDFSKPQKLLWLLTQVDKDPEIRRIKLQMIFDQDLAQQAVQIDQIPEIQARADANLLVIYQRLGLDPSKLDPKEAIQTEAQAAEMLESGILSNLDPEGVAVDSDVVRSLRTEFVAAFHEAARLLVEAGLADEVIVGGGLRTFPEQDLLRGLCYPALAVSFNNFGRGINLRLPSEKRGEKAVIGELNERIHADQEKFLAFVRELEEARERGQMPEVNLEYLLAKGLIGKNDPVYRAMNIIVSVPGIKVVDLTSFNIRGALAETPIRLDRIIPAFALIWEPDVK